jgi:hypothetical protein
VALDVAQRVEHVVEETAQLAQSATGKEATEQDLRD